MYEYREQRYRNMYNVCGGNKTEETTNSLDKMDVCSNDKYYDKKEEEDNNNDKELNTVTNYFSNRKNKIQNPLFSVYEFGGNEERYFLCKSSLKEFSNDKSKNFAKKNTALKILKNFDDLDQELASELFNNLCEEQLNKKSGNIKPLIILYLLIELVKLLYLVFF